MHAGIESYAFPIIVAGGRHDMTGFRYVAAAF